MIGECIFRVEYLKTTDRKITQGYLPDWAYKKEGPLYILWPFFIDEVGTPLKEGEQIPEKGFAKMMLPELSKMDTHRQMIKKFDSGFFMEGNIITGKARIIEKYI